MSSFIPFFSGSGSGSGSGINLQNLHHLHQGDASGSTSTIEGFPHHFLSFSLGPHGPQVQPVTQHHSHVLQAVPSSVTLTPVAVNASEGGYSLKGIMLPTQPLPPEQALGLNHAIATGASKKPRKPKKAKSENQAETTYFKCAYCEYSCDKKDRLSRHVRIVHFKEKPFACTLCEYSTGRKDKLKRHQSTVHSQERPFKCDFCPHTSSRKDKLREHVQGVHYKNRPKRPKKKYPKKKKNQQAATQLQLQPQQQHQSHHLQQVQHEQPQHILIHQQGLHSTQPQHIVVSQGATNGIHVLTTAGGLTMTQLPVSLMNVTEANGGMTSHYDIKPHHLLT